MDMATYVTQKMQPPKRGRGRPKTEAGEKPNRSLRLDPEMWADIDEWQRQRTGEPILPRSGAVRMLIDIALQIEGVRTLSDATVFRLSRLRERKRPRK